jgi:hypothetical protein
MSTNNDTRPTTGAEVREAWDGAPEMTPAYHDAAAYDIGRLLAVVGLTREDVEMVVCCNGTSLSRVLAACRLLLDAAEVEG